MFGMRFGNLGMNKDHVTGFVAGVGVAAAGYYVYMKNKDKVDAFLMKNGINVNTVKPDDLTSLTIEELLLKKEQLEDVIAEKEMEIEVDQQPIVAEL